MCIRDRVGTEREEANQTSTGHGDCLRLTRTKCFTGKQQSLLNIRSTIKKIHYFNGQSFFVPETFVWIPACVRASVWLCVCVTFFFARMKYFWLDFLALVSIHNSAASCIQCLHTCVWFQYLELSEHRTNAAWSQVYFVPPSRFCWVNVYN